MHWISGSVLALGLLAASMGPVAAQRGGGHFGGGSHAPSASFGGGHFGGGHFGGGHFGGGSFHGFHGGGFRHGSHSFFGLSLGFGFGYPYYDYYPYYGYPYIYYPYSYYPDYYPYVPDDAPPPSYPDDPGPYVAPPPPQSQGDSNGDNDYYLYRHSYHNQEHSSEYKKVPGLTDAVEDIEAAFRNGDMDRLEKHVVATDTLTILSRGHDDRTVTGKAYLDTTRAAMPDMHTVRFELNDGVPAATRDTWVLSGVHVVRDHSGKTVTYYVSFNLKKQDDDWFITQVRADRM
jgi:hypothetical protein